MLARQPVRRLSGNDRKLEETMPDFDLTFTLNGKSVEARKGESVLDAALRFDMHIPHFCYH